MNENHGPRGIRFDVMHTIRWEWQHTSKAKLGAIRRQCRAIEKRRWQHQELEPQHRQRPPGRRKKGMWGWLWYGWWRWYETPAARLQAVKAYEAKWNRSVYPGHKPQRHWFGARVGDKIIKSQMRRPLLP